MREFNPYEVDVPRMLSLLNIEAEHKNTGWVMRCPSGLHEDRRPSFTVKDCPGERQHGLGWCFSCSWGGTAAQLVSHVLEITMQGAYGWLAENAMGDPVDIDRIVIQTSSLHEHVMSVPSGVQFSSFNEWPVIPLEFALKRGIASWQVDRWSIGYATSGPLAGRIFLPAWSASGKLLNYTSRSYLNSPLRYKSAKGSELPDIGALFGEQLWPALGSRDVVVVTEGILNALAVERVAAHLSLASLFGSNVTTTHVMKLATFEHVLVLTDPDTAGDVAAEKLVTALCRHSRVVRVVLPPKCDANDLERQNPGELLRRLGAVRCGETS